MSTVRKTVTMLAMIGDGDFERELDDEMMALNAALLEHTGGRKKAKAKGKITVTFDFEVVDGAVTITPDLAVKKPKPARSTGFFWLTPGGELSTEHPQQMRMDFEARAKAGTAIVAPTTALA